jgi:hypothetical protein
MEKAKVHAGKMACDDMWKGNVYASLVDGTFQPIAEAEGIDADGGFERDAF